MFLHSVSILPCQETVIEMLLDPGGSIIFRIRECLLYRINPGASMEGPFTPDTDSGALFLHERIGCYPQSTWFFVPLCQTDRDKKRKAGQTVRLVLLDVVRSLLTVTEG